MSQPIIWTNRVYYKKNRLKEVKCCYSAIDLYTRRVHLVPKQQYITLPWLQWRWLKRGGSESRQPVCLWHHCSASGTETWICWPQSSQEEICCPLWLPEHECRCPSLHRPTVVVIQIRGSDKSEPYERLLVKQVWNAPKQGIARTRTIHTCCLQIGTIIWRCWNLHWQTSESNNPSQENRCLLRACSTVSPLNSAAPQAELMWGRLQCWVMEEENIQLKILHICSAVTLTSVAD